MSNQAANPLTAQNQDRLKNHFLNNPESEHPKRWDDLWREGTFIPWDRGFANPALVDTLNSHPSYLPPALKDGKRLRALVPGCGKGYDVSLLAAHGYDAYGLEISESAVKAAEEWLKSVEGKDVEDVRPRDEKAGKGVSKVLLGDFFKDEWMEECGGREEGFDVIYDCTFLCALPLSLRSQWASRMSQLLSPTGVLICLEFPTYKNPKAGGPPWALPSSVHVELLKRPGEEIQYDEEGKVVVTERPESETALVRIAHWKPERTHKVGIIDGEVTDRVSVWRHK